MIVILTVIAVGWVSVTIGQGRSVTLKAFTPDGRGCSLRMPPLLQYAVNLRGKRIQGTAAYRTRHPKMCGGRGPVYNGTESKH